MVVSDIGCLERNFVSEGLCKGYGGYFDKIGGLVCGLYVIVCAFVYYWVVILSCLCLFGFVYIYGGVLFLFFCWYFLLCGFLLES